MLIGSTISLNTMMLGSTSFTPATLFSRGEQGVWLDPSDVANLNWLYNLLTFTEQFDVAPWFVDNTSVSSNFAIAPDGTSTAERLLETAAISAHAISQTVTVSAAAHCYSIYLKKGSGTTAPDWVQLTFGGVSTGYANFNLSSGTVGVTSGATASITNIGSGWFRCSIVSTPTAGSMSVQIVFTNNIDTATRRPSYAGATTSDILIWGAQLEVGSVASPYQAITTVDAGVVERFPLNTMFQDRNGTTPVTTPGQLVGLRLDKSRQLALGPELVVNGDFSQGTTGWTTQTGWSISAGAASVNSAAAGTTNLISTSVSVTAGKTYRITYTISSVTGSGIRASIGGTVEGNYRQIAGTYTAIVTAASTTSFQITASSTDTVGSVDNISVRELAGNHAMAVSDATRGIYGIEPYGGRRNLLLATDSPTASIGTSVATNVAAAPNGTNNAARVSKTDATTPRYTSQSWTAGTIPAANTVYTASRYVKYDGHNTTVSLEYNSDLTFGLAWIATFNVTPSGVTANAPSLCTSSVQDAGNGWYRISATFTSGATTAAATLVMLSQITGASGVSVLMFGAQLEVVPTATAIASPYQRVTTQYDVTETGVPTVHYVEYSSDAYVTPTIDPSLNPPLGPELVTNGDFSAGSTGWTFSATPPATVSFSGGAFTFSSPGGEAAFAQQPILTIGRSYQVTVVVAAVAGAGVRIQAGSSATGAGQFTITSPGTYTITLLCNGTDGNLFITRTSISSGTVDSISVQELVTDEVQVFAGVRKLSDAAIGMLVEFSPNLNTNAGTFWLGAPINAGTNAYNFLSRGSIVPAAGASAIGAIAPCTNVITGIGDISADGMTIRNNGSNAGSSALDQGTGSYGAYPLYIGARGGSSLFFDGRDYGIIVRFGPNLSNTMISNTEDWLGEKTGVLYVLLNGVWQDQYTWVDNLNWNDGV